MPAKAIAITVKSIIAQMVISGGVDTISSTIGTAIQGGSFTDNFKTALLSNVAGQIQAEGANLIGDKFQYLYVDKQGNILGHTGKALSHAGLAALSAEISGGNVKGAAIGALAAELAAISLDSKSKNNLEGNTQKIKVLGAIAGAIVTGESNGAHSAAGAAENVFLYNHYLHNFYGSAGDKYFGGAFSLEKALESDSSLTVQEKQKIRSQYLKGDGKEDPVKAILEILPVSDTMMALMQAKDTKDYAAAVLTSLPMERAVVVLGKLAKITKVNNVFFSKFGNSDINPIKDVNSFISIEQGNMNKKLGTKIGQGRLPYERSSDGVKQAFQTVQKTLNNVSAVSDRIPAASVRGQYDLIHVYSEKTNSTVSLRVLPNGKYEFDTLIPEKSSKFK